MSRLYEPETYYWSTNFEWFEYDHDMSPYLTEKATEKARVSFENYQRKLSKGEIKAEFA